MEINLRGVFYALMIVTMLMSVFSDVMYNLSVRENIKSGREMRMELDSLKSVLGRDSLGCDSLVVSPPPLSPSEGGQVEEDSLVVSPPPLSPSEGLQVEECLK